MRRRRWTWVLCLVVLVGSGVGSGRADHLDRYFTREIGFYITAKGVLPNATADVDVLVEGRIFGSYRRLPLGIENTLHGDSFPRFAPLEVRIVINYIDPIKGTERRYVDEAFTLPAGPKESGGMYGVEYDLREESTPAASSDTERLS